MGEMKQAMVRTRIALLLKEDFLGRMVSSQGADHDCPRRKAGRPDSDRSWLGKNSLASLRLALFAKNMEQFLQ